MPPQLLRDCFKQLSGEEGKWAVLGIKLGLITAEEVHFYRTCSNWKDLGALILSNWQESDCSHMDLVAALRDKDIQLDNLASQIELYFDNFCT